MLLLADRSGQHQVVISVTRLSSYPQPFVDAWTKRPQWRSERSGDARILVPPTLVPGRSAVVRIDAGLLIQLTGVGVSQPMLQQIAFGLTVR